MFLSNFCALSSCFLVYFSSLKTDEEAEDDGAEAEEEGVDEEGRERGVGAFFDDEEDEEGGADEASFGFGGGFAALLDDSGF